ncbi:CapA family protein [Clostridium paraputrificum]|uniref:CapA family protein n=1 Tax=Clostridium TaxID=1485 RepID=UPI003D3252DA
MNKNKYKLYCLIIIGLLSFSFLGCKNSSVSTISTKTETNTDSKEINIVFAGDVLMHGPQLKSGYDAINNTYNFDDFFTYVNSYISNADLAICNSETSYLGAGSTYSGYPTFNSPTELLSSLKNTGFDVLASAHNHILDKGVQGFNNTSKAITDSGFDLIGIKNSLEDKNYIVKDINGIKIGITNYTYSTLDSTGARALNGIPVPKELNERINLFSDSNIDNDLVSMKSTLDAMKADGAEFSIFYLHWGNEYQRLPSKEQEKIAKVLNSYGVDAIIGSHPHVVQPVRTIKNDESDKETLVCYSLGNFVSNQRKETMGNIRSEDGLMITLTIYKDEDSKVRLKSYETEPTWVYKYVDKAGKDHYNILPVEEILNDKDDRKFTKDVFNKIQDSYNATESTIKS